MNVHDRAYELAKAIKESSEYKDMLEIRSRINGDESSRNLLDNFRRRQSELQQQMAAGSMPPEEEMEQLQKLYDTLSLNAGIKQLFEAERRLSVVLEDVQRIIAEPLQAMMK